MLAAARGKKVYYIQVMCLLQLCSSLYVMCSIIVYVVCVYLVILLLVLFVILLLLLI